MAPSAFAFGAKENGQALERLSCLKRGASLSLSDKSVALKAQLVYHDDVAIVRKSVNADKTPSFRPKRQFRTVEHESQFH